MPPIYIFQTSTPRSVESVTRRIDRDLRTLETNGALLDQSIPEIVVSGRPPNTETVLISGVATMANGLGIVYAHELRTRRENGRTLVYDEFRSYGAVVVGEDVLIRYDSGHESHKPYPHVESPWADDKGIHPPALDISRPVDLQKFVMAVEDWRLGESWRLPQEAPELDRLRRP